MTQRAGEEERVEFGGCAVEVSARVRAQPATVLGRQGDQGNGGWGIKDGMQEGQDTPLDLPICKDLS